MAELPDESLTRCWKVQGIFGDRSCVRLEDLGHCRHCDVYATAGRRRLDREIPPGAREEWAVLLGQEKEIARLAQISVIVFRLKDEWLALKTGYFQEATEPAVPHTIPGRSNKIFKGIVNVNGELLLCVSAADLLELTDNVPSEDGEIHAEQGKTFTTYARLVVIVRDGARFVFPVEEVLGVHRFAPEDLRDLPATLSKSARALTSSLFILENRTVGLLDEGKFFNALARSLTT